MNKEEQLLTGFRDLYNKLIWLNKDKMEESLKGHKASEVHCIECIGKNTDANVTKLADSLYMTNGAISKITRKLMDKGLIESYQKPENRKEIYFRLTGQGQEVYDIHEALHSEFQERDKAVFAQITAEQWGSMLGFVDRYNRHLDAEMKKQNTEMKPEMGPE